MYVATTALLHAYTSKKGHLCVKGEEALFEVSLNMNLSECIFLCQLTERCPSNPQ